MTEYDEGVGTAAGFQLFMGPLSSGRKGAHVLYQVIHGEIGR